MNVKQFRSGAGVEIPIGERRSLWSGGRSYLSTVNGSKRIGLEAAQALLFGKE